MHTVEVFGEPTPSVPVRMSSSAWRLNPVPSEPQVAPSLCVTPLPELCFPGHPQPWSLRKCAGDFEPASPPLFDCPFSAQMTQCVGVGHPGSD
jgi:hypothetical protein